MRNIIIVVAIGCAAIIAASGCGGGQGNPTAVHTDTPLPLPTDTPLPLPSATPDAEKQDVLHTVVEIDGLLSVAATLNGWAHEELLGSTHRFGDWDKICGNPNARGAPTLKYGYALPLYWPKEYKDLDIVVSSLCKLATDYAAKGKMTPEGRQTFATLIGLKLEPLTNALESDRPGDIERKVGEIRRGYWHQ